MIERDANNERNVMETDLLTSQLMLVEALFEIATESREADIVRRAVAGLQATEAGRNYLAINPLAV